MSIGTSESPSGPGGSRRSDLAEIARRQKGVLACIAAYLVAVVLQFVLPDSLAVLAGVIGFLAWIGGVVFVGLLGSTLYGTTTGVILAIATLIPIVGLVILIVVNVKATGILKEHGVAVGFLGARGEVR